MLWQKTEVRLYMGMNPDQLEAAKRAAERKSVWGEHKQAIKLAAGVAAVGLTIFGLSLAAGLITGKAMLVVAPYLPRLRGSETVPSANPTTTETPVEASVLDNNVD